MKLKLIAFIMLFLSCDLALAQRQWEQTNGPYGANVESILASPDGNIYAATSMGIYRSNNAGTSWLKLDDYIRTQNLAVNNEGHLFAISFIESQNRYGLYRSIDSGNTWEMIFESDTSETLNIIALNSQGHIFLLGESLYVSVDNGESWEEKESIRPFSVAVNSKDHLIASNGDSLYISTDNGNSWSNMGALPDNSEIREIAINSNDDIFVGSSSWKVYKSSDDGASWEFIMDTYYVPLIEINSDDDVFVSFFENGIRRSTDDGATWEIINNGLTYSNINDISFDSDNNIYVGTKKGVFRSFDNGDNWEFASTGLNSNNIASLDVNSSGDIFAATNSELYRSTDKGENWAMIYQVRIDTTIRFFRIFENGDIYIALYDHQCEDCGIGGAHVLRSRDNGDTWEDLFIEEVSAVDFIGFNETGELIIKTYQGWYISSDDGETFVKQPDTFNFIRDTVSTQPGISFRIKENSIEKSIDNGYSWEKTLIVESPSLFYLNINSHDHLFAAAKEFSYYPDTSMMFRSTDQGETWDTVFFIEGIVIQEVLIAPNDHLYLATDEGVHMSTDNGDNWTEINEGLEVLNITDIVLDNTGTLYAAALNAGVWKYDLMVSTKSVETNPDFSIYPNPTRGNITINLPGKMPSNTRLDIFNIQGMLVKSIPVMNSKLTINISNLLPGPYLVNVTGIKKGQIVIVD